MLEIKVLHNEKYHAWQTALQNLQEVLEENDLEADVDIVLVEGEEQASELGMKGSPTIIIDGHDADPKADRMKASLSACRIYLYKKKVYDFPPKEMIEKALGLA